MELIFAFVLLLASIPAGYILKHLTKEEIQDGRKYFKIIWITSLILAISFLFFSFNDSPQKQTLIFSLLFITNVAFISWRK